MRLTVAVEASGGIRTTEFHPESAFKLAEDLRVRDGLAGLVVLDDGRLLVYLLREVFLRELLLHACGLDGLDAGVPV